MVPATDRSCSFDSSLDVRSKTIIFVLLMVWSFLFDHPLCHLVLCILIISTGYNSGMTIRRQLRSVLPLLPLLLLIVIFAGFTDKFTHKANREILFSVRAGLAVTQGGMLLGLTFALRLINMVLSTKTFLACTPLDDLIQLFQKLKLPTSVSLVLTMSIRFFPELDRKKQLIISSQKARGAEINESAYLRGLYIRISLMIPLIINSIIMAEKLSLALLTRGFGYANHRTELQELHFKKKDYFILIICILGMCAGIALKFYTGWGQL